MMKYMGVETSAVRSVSVRHGSFSRQVDGKMGVMMMILINYKAWQLTENYG